MKEILIQNYNLDLAIDIQENDMFCCFLYQSKKYYFVEYFRSEEEFSDLYALTEELIQKKIPTGKFIINNLNQFLTHKDDKMYVLIEMPINSLKEYNVLEMIEYHDFLKVGSKRSVLYRNSWGSLWSSKIDYFEYQVAQLGKNKPIILNSFSYYVGLAENAISYVNNTIKNHQISIYENITLQRKRISFPNIHLNYFNPLNYVIDVEVRDIASYFKSLFFNSYEDLWIEVNAFLKRRRLSVYGYQLLYARLLFPSYYFDIYEKVMEDKIPEEELLKIINKAEDYEYFLKDIYIAILKYASIEKVDWIVNKKEL